MAEQVCCCGNSSDLYSLSAWFKFRPRHWKPWSFFFFSVSRRMTECCVKWRHDYSLPIHSLPTTQQLVACRILWLWGVTSCGIERRVVLWKSTEASEEYIVYLKPTPSRDYFSILKMEAVCSSVTTVDFNRTAFARGQNCSIYCLLGLLFDPKSVRNMLLRNVNEILPDCTTTYARWHHLHLSIHFYGLSMSFNLWIWICSCVSSASLVKAEQSCMCIYRRHCLYL
jgi:hypothetical protein